MGAYLTSTSTLSSVASAKERCPMSSRVLRPVSHRPSHVPCASLVLATASPKSLCLSGSRRVVDTVTCRSMAPKAVDDLVACGLEPPAWRRERLQCTRHGPITHRRLQDSRRADGAMQAGKDQHRGKEYKDWNSPTYLLGQTVRSHGASSPCVALVHVPSRRRRPCVLCRTTCHVIGPVSDTYWTTAWGPSDQALVTLTYTHASVPFPRPAIERH